MSTKILDILLQIKTNSKSNYGICSHMDDFRFNDIDYKVSKAMKLWPKYSGCAYYPIPSCNKSAGPVSAYVNAQSNGTLWSKRSAYGRLRWELLDFLIEHFNLNKS